jgi:RNA polymerase sigma-70 factor, ECF subfamily
MSSPKPNKVAEKSLPFLATPPPEVTDELPPQPSHLDDDAILQQVAVGDTRRLGELFARYHPRLLCLLRNYCPKGVDPDDTAQDAWLKVVQRASQFRPGSNFMSWLTRIALNEGISANRRTRRFLGASDELLAGLPDREESHGEIDPDLEQAFTSCKEALPERTQKIVEQRGAGVQNQDIAIYHKISQGTASAIYKDALKQLLDCIRGKLS